jgi:hypothetical protein
MHGKVVTVAVEGDHDAAVVRRILAAAGFEAGFVHGLRGKGALDRSLAGFNRGARHSPWLVVRDLDHDAECAVTLAGQLVPAPERWMCLRIAVRALEAWLLADREEMGRFLQVPLAKVPLRPESLDHPKLALVELAKHSKARAVRDDMVPVPGTRAQVGRGYTGRVIEFASRHWNPERAAHNSDSLHRCLRALRRWR